MRRDVGNVLIRLRRDLRLALADRYRALLGTRFAVLSAVVAAAMDHALAAPAVVRRLRRPTRQNPPSALGATLVRAAVTGGDQLALTLANAPTGVDGVALTRGSTRLALTTVTDRSGLVRLVADLPVGAADGDDWTVALTRGDTTHEVTAPGPDALVARRGQGDELWPPRLRVEAGRLLLRARRPDHTPLVPTVRVGVRTATVRWPAPDAGPATLVLTGPDERTVDAVVSDGVAVATLDLGAVTTEGRWLLSAGTSEGRVPLAFPPEDYPVLDGLLRPVRVRLPAAGATGRTVELGYSPDNQLELRVGNLGSAVA